MLRHSDYYLYNAKQLQDGATEIMTQLKSEGFVAIRGVFSETLIEDTTKKVTNVFQNPSISGSYGYYRKDYAKLLFDPLLLSGKTVDFIVNEAVLDFVEAYLEGEAVIAECNLKKDLGVNEVYFPYHADFAPGWRVKENNESVCLSDDDLNRPVAVGAMVYLHDTSDGAFCYSKGTHLMPKKQGHALSDYPEKLQQEVKEKMVRVEGKAGDLVLFDDRGFHGPEQPVSVPRTVLLFDYYRLATFDNKTKVSFPVLLNDLGHLSQRQLRMLGLGIEALIPYQGNHTRSFNQTKHYNKLTKVMAREFSKNRLFVKCKRVIRNLSCKILN